MESEKKKKMTAVSFTTSSDFFTPKIRETRFLNIRFELSLRPYSYSAESSAFQVTPGESPETSKNPRDDVMCETIMVMLCSNTYKKWLQHHVILNLFAFDMSCVATT